MRALDLFCGAGGVSMGLHRAGFDVVGVDIKPQPRYPFEFRQADAMTFPLEGFDFIWASPPCQGYTTMNNRRGSSTPKLITETRARLIANGKPFVIENVLGARRYMHNPILLHGGMFGLGVHRPRLFESDRLILSAPAPRNAEAIPVYGKMDGRRLWSRRDGSELRACKSINDAREAMGIDWMEWDEIREAIPPAYSEFIGKRFLELSQ